MRKPPAIGPIAVRPPLIPKKIARARPRSCTGKADTTIASAAGTMIAAATPCAARKATSQVWAIPEVGVAPHNAEEAANPMIPIVTIRRQPRTSASLPPSANVAARARR